MSKVKDPTGYKRKSILEEKINNGQKIEGTRGFVPSEVKCCSGSSTIYVPVRVVKARIADCSMTLVVASIADDNYDTEESFNVNPKDFFRSKEEIKQYEDHMVRLREYNQLVKKFEYQNCTLTRCRAIFAQALDECPNDMRVEIESEYADDPGKLRAMSREQMKPYYERMVAAKVFKDYGPDYDPQNDDDNDEDFD